MSSDDPDSYAVSPASLNVISLLYFSVYNLLWSVRRGDFGL